MKIEAKFKRRLRNAALTLLAAWGVYTGYYVWQLYSTWTTAVRQYESRNFTAAVPAFRRYLSLHPDDPHGHYLLGKSLAFLKQTEAAAVEMQEAVGRDARNPVFQAGLGHVLARLKRYPEAETAFRRAIALKPEDGEYHVLLGFMLYQQASDQEAAVEFRRALQLDPNSDKAKLGFRRLREARQESTVSP